MGRAFHRVLPCVWPRSKEPAGPVFLKEATVSGRSVGVSCDSMHADQPAAPLAGSLWRDTGLLFAVGLLGGGQTHEEHQVRAHLPYRLRPGPCFSRPSSALRSLRPYEAGPASCAENRTSLLWSWSPEKAETRSALQPMLCCAAVGVVGAQQEVVGKREISVEPPGWFCRGAGAGGGFGG